MSIIASKTKQAAELDHRYTKYSKDGAAERKADAADAAKRSLEIETGALNAEKDSVKQWLAAKKEEEDSSEDADSARVGAAMARLEHVSSRQQASSSAYGDEVAQKKSR